MKRILLACNAFKESCSSFELNHALAEIIEEVMPGNESTVFPVSDGGDGFLETIAYHKSFEITYLQGRDISGQDREIPYIFDPGSDTLYLESAAVIGLALIPTGARHPANYNSSVLAKFIHLVLEYLENKQSPVSTICIGIGGTATIDAGSGFYNYFKMTDDKLFNLSGLRYSGSSGNGDSHSRLPKIILVLDVDVPLSGEQGMIQIFGPQKGLSKEEIPGWEQHITELLKQWDLRSDEADDIKYLGAGGGIAVGIGKVFETECLSGEEFLLKELKLADAIKSHDIIITGEGKLDNSTFSKKAVSAILTKAAIEHKKIVVICGTAEESAGLYLQERNIPLVLLSDGTPGDIDYSIKNPILKLKRSSSELISHLK